MCLQRKFDAMPLTADVLKMNVGSWIPLPPPTRYTDLGPFESRPTSVARCCGTCKETSFVLKTTPCVGCTTEYMTDGTAYRAMGVPGWYVFERIMTEASTVLILLQVIQNTAVPVFLTPDQPWAIGYVDLVQGYSVYLFVGRALGQGAPCYAPPLPATMPGCCAPSHTLEEPTAETATTCRPWEGFVAVCGPGCLSLVTAPEITCPSDNVGGQCLSPCDALIVGVRAPDIIVDPPVTAQVLLAFLDPIMIVPGDSPVVIRLTNRPCSEITPATAAQDLKLTFSQSFPGLTYLKLTQTAPGIISVEATSMLDLTPVTPVPTVSCITAPCTLPVDEEEECCSVTLYNICTQYDAAESLDPFVSIVAQVVWDSCEAACMLDLSVCKPLRLTTETASCCTFGLNITVLTVASEEDLIDQLTTPDSYDCGEDPQEPQLEFDPIPGPGPAPCPAPGTAPPGSTVRNVKLAGADTSSVRMLLSDGTIAGDWFAVGSVPGSGVDLRIDVTSASGLSTTPVIVVTNGITATAYRADTNAVLGAGSITLALSNSLVASPSSVSPLYVWTGDDVGGYVITSVVAHQESHVPPFLATKAVIIDGSYSAWWLKPMTGNLTEMMNLSSMVDYSTALTAVPLGTYREESFNTGVVLLGTHTDTTTSPDLNYYLLALTTAVVDTIVLSQAGIAADHSTLVFSNTCMNRITLTPTAALPQGTLILVAAEAKTEASAFDVDVFHAADGVWVDANAFYTTRESDAVQTAFDAQDTGAMVFVATAGGSLAAQLVAGGTWATTGAPSSTCPVTSTSLLPYDVRVAGAAQQLGVGAAGKNVYFHGEVFVNNYAQAATAFASLPSQWLADTPGVSGKPAVPGLTIALSPGDLAITGVYRKASSSVFYVGLVATTNLSVGTQMCLTTAAWPDIISDDAYVCASLTGAHAEGSVFVWTINTTSAALSVFEKLDGEAVPRTLLPVGAIMTVGTGTVNNPYDGVSPGFVTVFSGPPSNPSAATSITVRNPYTYSTLPSGLVAPFTALQRSVLYFNQPTTDEFWRFYIGVPTDATTNVMNVFDWSSVSSYLYEHACIQVIDPADATLQAFIDSLMWFTNVAA